jgi:hypothetical protein
VLGIKVAERGVQRPFADAGRTGEYDEASHSEKITQVFKKKNSRTAVISFFIPMAGAADSRLKIFEAWTRNI